MYLIIDEKILKILSRIKVANTYKFIYEANKGEGRKIYGALEITKSEADKVIIDVEEIKEKNFKLIYEKEGVIYGSLTGIVGDADEAICEVKALYEEAAPEEAKEIKKEENEVEVKEEEVIEEASEEAK